MPLMTSTLEDDTFDFRKFAIDYPSGNRYTFYVQDVTNAQYDELMVTPAKDALAGLNERITVMPQGSEDEEQDIEPSQLPHAIVANYLRFHNAFLRELGTSLTT